MDFEKKIPKLPLRLGKVRSFLLITNQNQLWLNGFVETDFDWFRVLTVTYEYRMYRGSLQTKARGGPVPAHKAF